MEVYSKLKMAPYLTTKVNNKESNDEAKTKIIYFSLSDSSALLLGGVINSNSDPPSKFQFKALTAYDN
jgi:hypothetical protein